MKNKKSTILLIVIFIITILVFVVGATFAFFSAQLSSGIDEDVTIRTHSSNTLTYNIDKAISVTADGTNFTQNDTDRYDEATGTVTYKAGSEQSTACYTLDLEVENNDFEYTVDSNTPELVLNVTKNGDPVITNKDITTGTNTVHVPTTLNGSVYKNEITAAAKATEQDIWVVRVTFKNLPTDQSDPSKTNNAEKSFDGSIVYKTVDCQTGEPIDDEEESTAYYWNDNFSSDGYTFPNTPATTYPTLAQLQNNYAEFSDRPFYIKTTSTENLVCVYYNDREFCMGQNYWVTGDSDGSQTKTKLKNDIESALEVSVVHCDQHSSSVSCSFGPLGTLSCQQDSSNYLVCTDNLHNQCSILDDGITFCIGG